MEMPATIMAAMRQADWAISIDLKDPYFHIPMAKRSRKYLRFVVRGRAYQFRALPFRLSTALLIFTWVMNKVAGYAHRQGIRLHIYLDELFLAKDTWLLLELCVFLGLLVNFTKSSLIPTREFVFLRIFFQAIPFTCRPSTDRWKRLLAFLHIFKRAKDLSACQWMCLIGTLTSMDSQVPLGMKATSQAYPTQLPGYLGPQEAVPDPKDSFLCCCTTG